MASLQEIFEDERPEQRKRRLNKERQTSYRKKQKSEKLTRHELGRMDRVCIHCGERQIVEESADKNP